MLDRWHDFYFSLTSLFLKTKLLCVNMVLMVKFLQFIYNTVTAKHHKLPSNITEISRDGQIIRRLSNSKKYVVPKYRLGHRSKKNAVKLKIHSKVKKAWFGILFETTFSATNPNSIVFLVSSWKSQLNESCTSATSLQMYDCVTFKLMTVRPQNQQLVKFPCPFII